MALACADIPIADLHARINNYQALNTLLILAVTALFGAALVTLMRRTVTQPILALEKSARDFAAKSHTIQNYQELKYQRPEITTENEVKPWRTLWAKWPTISSVIWTASSPPRSGQKTPSWRRRA